MCTSKINNLDNKFILIYSDIQCIHFKYEQNCTQLKYTQSCLFTRLFKDYGWLSERILLTYVMI